MLPRGRSISRCPRIPVARLLADIGMATYTRTVAIPPAFVGDGLELWLTAGRIQRSAKFYADGKLFGEHVGYLSLFEARLPLAALPGAAGAAGNANATGAAAPTFELKIEVNATRKHGVDGLQGEEDLETDGTGLGVCPPPPIPPPPPSSAPPTIGSVVWCGVVWRGVAWFGVVWHVGGWCVACWCVVCGVWCVVCSVAWCVMCGV